MQPPSSPVSPLPRGFDLGVFARLGLVCLLAHNGRSEALSSKLNMAAVFVLRGGADPGEGLLIRGLRSRFRQSGENRHKATAALLRGRVMTVHCSRKRATPDDPEVGALRFLLRGYSCLPSIRDLHMPPQPREALHCSALDKLLE